MFLEKYLIDTDFELLISNYDIEYLDNLKEENFLQIYWLLYNLGFNFIEDIILNYLDLFELSKENVVYALDKIKKELGDNYINIISENLTIIDKIIDYAYELVE